MTHYYHPSRPGSDSSKVGIMVSNNDGFVLNGLGSIGNFQAGVLISEANRVKLSSLTLDGNQIGVFTTGSQNIEMQNNTLKQNDLGVAAHSNTGVSIVSNGIIANNIAGITLVGTRQSEILMNNINGSQNGAFFDGQSSGNVIEHNQFHNNTIDLNNANGLPTNINDNQFTDNNCKTIKGVKDNPCSRYILAIP